MTITTITTRRPDDDDRATALDAPTEATTINKMANMTSDSTKAKHSPTTHSAYTTRSTTTRTLFALLVLCAPTGSIAQTITCSNTCNWANNVRPTINKEARTPSAPLSRLPPPSHTHHPLARLSLAGHLPGWR